MRHRRCDGSHHDWVRFSSFPPPLDSDADSSRDVVDSYDSAFIGTSMALASFKNEFGLAHKTSKEFAAISANIVSTYQGGCFFGSLVGYPLGQILGRRIGLFISALVFVLGAGVVSRPNAFPPHRDLTDPLCTRADARG